MAGAYTRHGILQKACKMGIFGRKLFKNMPPFSPNHPTYSHGQKKIVEDFFDRGNFVVDRNISQFPRKLIAQENLSSSE